MADSDEMRDLLAYAAYNKVAAALTVSRNTVSLWAKGRNVTPYRLRQVRDLLRPETVKEPQPEWAGAMEQRLTETILANREIVQALAEQTARIGVERTLGAPPPAAPSPDKRGSQREPAGQRSRR